MANGSTASSSGEPPAQPGFRGANPVALRIDSDGVLRRGSDPFPSTSIFATSATPILQIQPQWFNAPSFFVHQNKPSAFCKLGLAQRKALSPMANQLNWSITYSLLTAANQDVAAQSFTLSPQDADKLSNIPLPGGRGQFTCRVYAYVGGDPGKTFQIIDQTIKMLQGVGGSSSLQTFLAIPATDLSGLAQAESLFHQVLQATAPPQWSQHWINSNSIELAANADASRANAGALRLAYGTNVVIVIPAQSNPSDHPQGQPDSTQPYFQTIGTFVGKSQFQFALDPDGITMSGGNNPFDEMPYVALVIEVDNAPQ